MKWQWLGGVAIAMVTLILSDIWREARPSVFGFKWGDALYAIATTPYAHYMLVPLVFLFAAIWVLYKRFEFSLLTVTPYFRATFLSLSVGNTAVLAIYLLLGKANGILDELKEGGVGPSLPFFAAAITMAIVLFHTLMTGDGLKRRVSVEPTKPSDEPQRS